MTSKKAKPKARASRNARSTTRHTRVGKRAGKRAGKRVLLPVMRAQHNMRDIIKQLALVEDHHIHPTKRCGDCLKKHHCTLEGLAEEAVTLCKPGQGDVAADARRVARTVRVMQHAWGQRPRDDRLNVAISNRLRRLRKRLMTRYALLPVDKLPEDESAEVRSLLNATRRPNARRGARRPRANARRSAGRARTAGRGRRGP